MGSRQHKTAFARYDCKVFAPTVYSGDLFGYAFAPALLLLLLHNPAKDSTLVVLLIPVLYLSLLINLYFQYISY